MEFSDPQQAVADEMSEHFPRGKPVPSAAENYDIGVFCENEATARGVETVVDGIEFVEHTGSLARYSFDEEAVEARKTKSFEAHVESETSINLTLDTLVSHDDGAAYWLETRLLLREELDSLCEADGIRVGSVEARSDTVVGITLYDTR